MVTNLFSNIFGEKSWAQSLTAWGLVIYVAGESLVTQACGSSLLPENLCGFLTSAVQNIGVVLTALGIRKAANI